MDPYFILDKNGSEAAPNEELNSQQVSAETPPAEPSTGELRFPAEDGGRSLAEMAQRDLNATLQLLTERAQYITGATGAAIALRNGKDMVCRARAGTSAPEVGAELQANSGLSGESVRTKQTLRCDDAWTDTRVNRESCEALGIRSVVVMPLVQDEQVVGVFELFSDKANVFEARDITALERMGSMVHAALEQSDTAVLTEDANTDVEDVLADEASAESEEAVTEEPRGELARTLAEAPGTAEAAHVEPATEAPAANSETSQRGQIEDLGASLNTGSGIAFHRRIPAKADAGKGEMQATGRPATEEVHPDSVAAIAPEQNAEIAHPEPQVEGSAAERNVEGQSNIEEPAAEGPRRSTDSEDVDVLELPDVTIAQASSASGEIVSDPSTEEILSDVATDDVLEVSTDTSAEQAAHTEGPTPESSADAAPSEHSRPEEHLDEQSPIAAVQGMSPTVRGAVAQLKKCEVCGFPVSEGRQLCLDCEKKQKTFPSADKPAKAADKPFHASPAGTDEPATLAPVVTDVAGSETSLFLTGEEEEMSWVASHKLMVVAVVLAVLVIVVLMMMR